MSKNLEFVFIKLVTMMLKLRPIYGFAPGGTVVEHWTLNHKIEGSNLGTCGLYYKHITIVTDTASVISK